MTVGERKPRDVHSLRETLSWLKAHRRIERRSGSVYLWPKVRDSAIFHLEAIVARKVRRASRKGGR